MQIKVVMLGDSDAGKTSIVQRFKNNKFDNSNFSIGFSTTVKEMVIQTKQEYTTNLNENDKCQINTSNQVKNNMRTPQSSPNLSVGSKLKKQYLNDNSTYSTRVDQIINLQIWDTCGQERFKSLTSNYCRHCNAVYLVYDVQKPKSLISCQQWIDLLKKQPENENYKVFLVANKADDCSEITSEQVQKQEEFCIKNQIKSSFFTSAKTGYNIKESFEKVCKDCIENGLIQSNELTLVEDENRRDLKGCCM